MDAKYIAPTERTDGTPLAAGEIVAYQLGIATSDTAFGSVFAASNFVRLIDDFQPEAGSQTTAIPTDLSAGKYRIAVRAKVNDTSSGKTVGVFGPWSTAVDYAVGSKSPPKAPGKPTLA